MNLQQLIQQYTGVPTGGTGSDTGHASPSAASKPGQQAWGSVPGGLVGGALGGLAAGGLMSLLLGSKKSRKVAGKMAAYGSAAALGAVALRAWQGWQSQNPKPGDNEHWQSVQNLQSKPPSPGLAGPFNVRPLAADGQPFELALVRAMISAANADGHIGPDEQRRIFDHIAKLDLNAGDKAFLFDAISKPDNAAAISGLANGLEQASELWLAARLAIDPDDPREEAYLTELATGLKVPDGLVAQLELRMQNQLTAAA